MSGDSLQRHCVLTCVRVFVGFRWLYNFTNIVTFILPILIKTIKFFEESLYRVLKNKYSISVDLLKLFEFFFTCCVQVDCVTSSQPTDSIDF